MVSIGKIKKVYEQNPLIRNHLESRGGRFEEILRKAEEETSRREFYTPDPVNRSHTVKLLSYIPPEMLYEHFGEEALVSSWAEGLHTTQEREELADLIQNVTGKDASRLEQARLTAFQLLHNKDAALIMKIYDSNMAVLNGLYNYSNLSEMIQKNLLPGIGLSEGKIKRYSLSSLEAGREEARGWDTKWSAHGRTGSREGESYSVYVDGPVGISLNYEGNPSAVVSFFPSDLDTLMINQWQGIRPNALGPAGNILGKTKSRGLGGLDWKNLLVDITEKMGYYLGMSRLGIQGAINNCWTRPDQKGKLHIPYEDALKAYDESAEGRGFRKEADGNLYRQIDIK